ncbi:hypothetical protein [Kitasatospora sp. McL0602]|uniref:hypothetical protein n=1 Tax=Kitasatospora sp. McL0602 TaxID=3439530 RepID=UPI003F894E35
MAGSDLRAPMYAQKGLYDALDFRNLTGRLRGGHVGVAGSTALHVTRLGEETHKLNVAAGSLWLPDNAEVRHEASLYFAHLDADLALEVVTEGAGDAPLEAAVVAYADPDAKEPGSRSRKHTDPRLMLPPGGIGDPSVHAADEEERYYGGWAIDIVYPKDGQDGLAIPRNALVLAKFKYNNQGLVDQPEDWRFHSGVAELVPGQVQVDTTPLLHLRTAGSQSPAELAKQAPEGSLIYDHVRQTMVMVTNQAEGLVKGMYEQRHMEYLRGPDNWEGDLWWRDEASPSNWFLFREFEIPAVPYDRWLDFVFFLQGHDTVANADYQGWLRLYYGDQLVSIREPHAPGRGQHITLEGGKTKELRAGQSAKFRVEGGCTGGIQWTKGRNSFISVTMQPK